jgi:hypothetical protein
LLQLPVTEPSVDVQECDVGELEKRSCLLASSVVVVNVSFRVSGTDCSLHANVKDWNVYYHLHVSVTDVNTSYVK